ncbi:winged helix-turn-helix domain-containing protein [Niveispirillum fermenti]|uniref:winged helix-turn-helix domain-containing protein n=1 Tax=Niveispirillum fermenti TaxID=1233113 RepID=UPI003A84EC91
MQPDAGHLAQETAAELAVGAYRFHRDSGRLTCRNGAAVPLGRRATAMLSILAEHAGRDVSAGQLLDRVWPGQIVDPANVAVQISGLRAAIGDSDGSVILTVHGRGYRLATPTVAAPVRSIGNIPLTLAPLAGRTVELANTARLMRRDRLLVITGLSGTGKTLLACAAARALAADHPDGQWLVPVSGAVIADAETLAARILMVVDPAFAGEPVASLLGLLKGRACLLLLDGAELLGDGAVSLVYRLLERCPQVGLLLTSHVAHRRLWRYCVRLSPLSLPGGDALAPAAPGLFMQAAAAAGLDIGIDGQTADAVAGICRNLGGVPLGVEIAARAASLLGLRATADACRDPVRSLPGIRRAGPARHRSVAAAMGWALDLLTGDERQALLALSRLPGDFTADEADRALAGGGARQWLGGLLEKSMLDRHGDRFSLNPLVRAGARNTVAGS